MSAAARASGVLLHPTALPGTPCCGSFGAAARAWIDLLAEQGVGVWQLLPLAPTDGTGSPYSSPSGSALNPWLIDADDLVADGLITPADREALPQGGRERLDPQGASERAAAIATALGRRWADQPPERQEAFERWQRRQHFWLVDHCRFMVIRRLQAGRPWWDWPEALARHRRVGSAGPGGGPGPGSAGRGPAAMAAPDPVGPAAGAGPSAGGAAGRRPALLRGPRQRRCLEPPAPLLPAR